MRALARRPAADRGDIGLPPGRWSRWQPPAVEVGRHPRPQLLLEVRPEAAR